MEKIIGKDFKSEIDMYGYPINPDAEYVIDHINSSGLDEYVTVEAWENSHRSASVDKIAPEFAMFFNGLK